MPTLIAAFLATVPLVVMIGNDDMASLPQTLWLQVAVPLLWTLWFLGGKASLPRPRPRVLVPVVALLSWSALSILWATDRFASERVLFGWVAAAGLAFLIAVAIESSGQAARLLMALFWASVAVSVLGLLQHLGGWSGIPQAFPPAGTMGNKNIAAGFVAVMSPLGVAAFVSARVGASLFAISVGLALAFVLHTGSRAAMLVLLVQAAAALWVIARRGEAPRWRPAKWGALCAGVGAFVVLAAMPPSRSSLDQGSVSELLRGTARPALRLLTGVPATPTADSTEGTPHEQRAERSVAIRLGVWRNALEMIRSAPLAGVGIGNFSVLYPRFARSAAVDGTRMDQRVESAHNDYVQLVAELGLLGAGLLVWPVLVTARSLVRGFRELHGGDRSLYLASGLGLLGLLVLAAVSRTVNQPIALIAAATFVGVAETFSRARPADANAKWEAPPQYAVSLGLIGASAAFVVASSWGLAQIRADRHVLRMAHAEARGDWPAAVREGLMARGLSPGRTDPRFGTASALLRLGRAEEAAGLLEELLAVDPYNANAIGNLAIAYANLGDQKRAAACFERVLHLRPDDEFAQAELRRITAPVVVADLP